MSSQKSVVGSVSSSVTGSAQGSVQGSVQGDANGDFVNGLLNKMMSCRMRRDYRGEPVAEMDVYITSEEVYKVSQMAVEVFMKQPTCLMIPNTTLPITVCGDIHGQFRDIRLVMERHGFVDKHSYLFLGDYADRGVQGVETIIYLLLCKIIQPDRVFMLRGNHEDYNTSMVYGLMDECLEKYGNYIGQRVWLTLINVFNHMPFAAVIDKKILCMHGGLSPEMKTVDDINKIQRPTLIPLYGMGCDLVWADPSNLHEGWALSPRGISFTFDDSVAERFCDNNGLDLIVRGHQITNEMHRSGYQFSPSGRVLTLFTAADYLRTANTGATMTVGQNLSVQFTLFRPVDRKRMRRIQRGRKDSKVQMGSD